MNDTDRILGALEDHRKEVRGDMSDLRQATTDMAKAVADLTTTVARVEERHARQDDGLKRLGRTVDDHETRLRVVEDTSKTRGASLQGGWFVLTVIGSVILGGIALWAALT